MTQAKPASVTQQGLGFASSPSELAVFRDPACAAAIWDRPLSPGLAAWLDGLDAARLPKWRETLAVEAVHEAVLDACQEAGTPDCPERAELITDIQQLADAFAALMQVEFVQIRLDVISSNACRRFHVDAVTGRMVCTLRGTGTQYGLAHEGQQPTEITTVSRGAPIFLRGTLWPTTPESSLLHRSPPIEGTGETRLVVVLDPVSNEDAQDVAA